jgi:hypothetical protein
MDNRSSIKKNKTRNNEINRFNNSISSNSNRSLPIVVNKLPAIKFISRKNDENFDAINTNSQTNDTTTDDEDNSNFKMEAQKFKIKNSSSTSNKKLSLKRTFFKNLKAISSSLSYSSSIESSTLPNSESDFDHCKNSNSKKQRDIKVIEPFKHGPTQTSSAWSSSSSQYYNNYNNRRATLGNQQKSTSVLTVNWSNLDYDEEDFAEAFRVFDKNGDGRITDKELSQVLKELGIIISEEDIRLMIAELDKDGNGTLYTYLFLVYFNKSTHTKFSLQIIYYLLYGYLFIFA